MKLTSIVSAGVAVLGVVNAAALPAGSDGAVKRDSTVENLDNPAWWGKKRDSDVENLDNPAWWGKKRDSDVENLDNPAWWGKKRDAEAEKAGSVFSPTGTPAAPMTT
ncbi:uncharacterized protein B0T15DRAFT_502195 [Chaetomium strumarium]|uniref:Uncharacterized protein n=1 Tax=Chaetomium strumarium TaxID=1170767 RepID=A0AAJ0GRZ2_9PEZI|nr:hypothetical protein B0T15DRAFT_502195 [Chaetomium strumarium]